MKIETIGAIIRKNRSGVAAHQIWKEMERLEFEAEKYKAEYNKLKSDYSEIIVKCLKLTERLLEKYQL